MITLYIGFDSSNYGQELAYEVCKGLFYDLLKMSK